MENTEFDKQVSEMNIESPEKNSTESQELTPDQIYNIISIAHMTACMEFEEPMAFEDIEKSFPEVLVAQDINSEEAYPKKGTSATFVSTDSEQLAFNEIIKKPEILFYFQNGLVEDEDFLQMWEVSKN